MMRKIILILFLAMFSFPLVCFGGASRLFDGSNDLITIANESNFDFERTNTFSMVCWYKPTITSPSNIGTIISKQSGSGGSPGYVILVRGDVTNDPYEIQIRNAATNQIRIQFPRTNDTKWHHVAMTYSGSSAASGVKVYEDGVELSASVQNDTLSSSILTDISLILGARDGTTSLLTLDGNLANCAVYNVVLSSVQIQELMFKPFTVFSGLKGLWGIWGNTSPELDLSGNGNTGTVTEATESSNGPPIMLNPRVQ